GMVGQQPELLLLLEDQLTGPLPAHVEAAAILLDPLAWSMMGRVSSPRREVQEERLVRGDLLGIAHEADRAIGQIFREMVTLLRRRWRFDLVVIFDQVGIVLVR